MAYIGKTPTKAPLSSSDLPDNIVTSAKIADATIVNADINDMASSKLSGTIADARFPATLPASSGANLTSIPAGNLTGTVADARISALTASKLTGALPAISGASLTGISGGKVLQVVSTTKTDTFSTTSTSWNDLTGLSVSITPSATSSKVLVFYQVMTGGGVGVLTLFQLVRGSTAIAIGDADGVRERIGAGHYAGTDDAAWHIASVNQNYLDSPSTTSATTYKVQCRPNSGTLTINRAYNDSNATYVRRSTSTITAMEIGA